MIKEIAPILPANAKEDVDAKGYLAVPTLEDHHIHLDKGHYGGEWQAVVPMSGVAERIVEEEGFLRDELLKTPEKAQALIDLITSRGATFLRVQVNVDPVIGLDNLAVIKAVLEKNKHKLNYEIVAFPQHGTVITEELGLLSKALADVSGKALTNTMKRLKEADIAINTTVPIGTQALSIPLLKSQGIRINVINDNINDH